MPLDWSVVLEKYGNGAQVPTVTGGKFLKVARADDTAIYIESPIWSATLDRSNLEKGVMLIEEGLKTPAGAVKLVRYVPGLV